MMSPANPLKTEIVYPDTDGKPMAESDPTRDYLIYGVEALGTYFQDRNDVYVSGNLFIYYKRGVPDAVVAPDVFVIFGVEKKKRMSYKAWEEGGRLWRRYSGWLTPLKVKLRIADVVALLNSGMNHGFCCNPGSLLNPLTLGDFEQVRFPSELRG